MSHGLGKTYHSQVTVLLLSFSFAYAQQPTPKPAPPLHTGSVTGQVLYEDTRAPARFVEVRLVPRPPDSALVPGSAPVDSPTPELQPPQISMAVGSTDIDGKFRIEDVPTGDYIAGALHIGYLTPGTDSEPTAPHETLQRLIAALPTVHVSENQVSRINLSLQRGAVIAGRVIFADGTPAVGVKVLEQSSVWYARSTAPSRRMTPRYVESSCSFRTTSHPTPPI